MRFVDPLFGGSGCFSAFKTPTLTRLLPGKFCAYRILSVHRALTPVLLPACLSFAAYTSTHKSKQARREAGLGLAVQPAKEAAAAPPQWKAAAACRCFSFLVFFYNSVSELQAATACAQEITHGAGARQAACTCHTKSDQINHRKAATLTFSTSSPPPHSLRPTGSCGRTASCLVPGRALDSTSSSPPPSLLRQTPTAACRRLAVLSLPSPPPPPIGPFLRPENIRLLKSSIYLDSNALDPDFYVHRNQAYIYEKAHNPYHPNINLSSDLYFEKQYTQQTERYEDPGLYLGVMHPQAISTLRSSREITIRWETDRAPEHPSPFWYSSFLRGVSMWNPKKGISGEFEVREPGESYIVLFQNVQTMSVGNVGGPYPLSLVFCHLPSYIYPFDRLTHAQLSRFNHRLPPPNNVFVVFGCVSLVQRQNETAERTDASPAGAAQNEGGALGD